MHRSKGRIWELDIGAFTSLLPWTQHSTDTSQPNLRMHTRQGGQLDTKTECRHTHLLRFLPSVLKLLLAALQELSDCKEEKNSLPTTHRDLSSDLVMVRSFGLGKLRTRYVYIFVSNIPRNVLLIIPSQNIILLCISTE